MCKCAKLGTCICGDTEDFGKLSMGKIVFTPIERKPHKCPVCEGIGTNDVISCKACTGTGVLWG